LPIIRLFFFSSMNNPSDYYFFKQTSFLHKTITQPGGAGGAAGPSWSYHFLDLFALGSVSS
jgi:hypothetical protein